MSWEKVLRLLVVSLLLEPGSEFRAHRHRFVECAMDALLEQNFAVADKDRLNRYLDRLPEHEQDLSVWLKRRWAELHRTPPIETSPATRRTSDVVVGDSEPAAPKFRHLFEHVLAACVVTGYN